MGVNDFYRTYRKVVVFDIEVTTWEGALARDWSGKNEFREIFQISAQALDMVQNRVVDAYDCFVKPRINPILSDYAKRLTRVTQDQVDNGVDFKEMYMDFLVWSDGLPLCSYSRKAGPEGEGMAIKENIDLYKLSFPYVPSRYINLMSFFRAAGVKVDRFSAGDLYKCFNLEVGGKTNNANHDVNSIVASLVALKEELPLLS